jgi:hypothetical protein
MRETRELGMADDRQLEIDFVQKNYEHNLKTANYLLGAHGACLLLALSALREYSTIGPVKGVGTFIVIFGVGLLAAIANYASLSLARGVAINAARNEAEADETTVKFISRAHLIALSISLLLFILAVLVAMWRFASL